MRFCRCLGAAELLRACASLDGFVRGGSGRVKLYFPPFAKARRMGHPNIWGGPIEFEPKRLENGGEWPTSASLFGSHHVDSLVPPGRGS
jgi:hypothetical protein